MPCPYILSSIHGAKVLIFPGLTKKNMFYNMFLAFFYFQITVFDSASTSFSR